MSNPPEPELLHDGRFIRLVRRGKWEFVQRKKISGIVGILAITDEGRLLLVEQYRPPLARRVIEIPAGLAGDVTGSETEPLAEAARRELHEETGYRAGQMIRLAEGAVSAGLSDEVVTLFRATGLTKAGDGGGDDTEEIQVHEVPLDQVFHWLAERMQAGILVDLKVYSALCFAGIGPHPGA